MPREVEAERFAAPPAGSAAGARLARGASRQALFR
jgi:hypothetical protein